MSGHIVVVGSLNIDLVVRTPRLPQIGETVLGSDFKIYPGGKGANQAVAAARLGCPVKMIGRVGDDHFGNILLESVRDSGVDTQFVQRMPQAFSGVAFITVDDDGQNTIVVASGANGLLTPDDVLAAEQAFRGASVLLIQLESPLAVIEYAIRVARSHGVQVVLNPAPAQLLDTDLLNDVDYLIPNQTELALLAGSDSTETAIKIMHELGVKKMVVTMGAEGALVVDDNFREHLPAHPVEVVDSTAAGDAFAGAFAVALREGHSIREAAAWGNAAGALTVTRAGAQPSLPTRLELETFLASLRI